MWCFACKVLLISRVVGHLLLHLLAMSSSLHGTTCPPRTDKEPKVQLLTQRLDLGQLNGARNCLKEDLSEQFCWNGVCKQKLQLLE